MLRQTYLAAALLLAPAALLAAPQPYELKIDESQIVFRYDLQGAVNQGTIGIRAADVLLDFEDVRRSDVTVVFDMTETTAGLALLTQAVKSEPVLATSAHPTATFQSTKVTRKGAGATLEGDLTLRGITRPVILDARIFRERGSEVGDLSDLVLLITGTLDRHDFGASGYSSFVGPDIALDVVVAVERK